MNKKMIILFLIYFIQVIVTSCVPPCDCEPIKTFETTYTNFELKAWNTSESPQEEIVNQAYKNDFKLTVTLQRESTLISYSKSFLDIRSFGFTSAYALSDCDCPVDEYLHTDPISSIEVHVLNVETKEVINITDKFKFYSSYKTPMNLNELYKNKTKTHDVFQIEIDEYDTIPDNSIFTVKIFLESGTEFLKQTQQINFE